MNDKITTLEGKLFRSQQEVWKVRHTLFETIRMLDSLESELEAYRYMENDIREVNEAYENVK